MEEEKPVGPLGPTGPCGHCGKPSPWRRNPYTWELYEEPNWAYRCGEIVEELSWDI